MPQVVLFQTWLNLSVLATCGSHIHSCVQSLKVQSPFFFLSSDDFQLEVTVINVNSYIYTVCVKGLGAFYFQIEMNL